MPAALIFGMTTGYTNTRSPKLTTNAIRVSSMRAVTGRRRRTGPGPAEPRASNDGAAGAGSPRSSAKDGGPGGATGMAAKPGGGYDAAGGGNDAAGGGYDPAGGGIEAA